jgi:hypothetical protein
MRIGAQLYHNHCTEGLALRFSVLLAVRILLCKHLRDPSCQCGGNNHDCDVSRYSNPRDATTASKATFSIEREWYSIWEEAVDAGDWAKKICKIRDRECKSHGEEGNYIAIRFLHASVTAPLCPHVRIDAPREPEILGATAEVSINCELRFNRVESACFSDPQSLAERNPTALRTSPLRSQQKARVQAETLEPPFAELNASAFWKGDGSAHSASLSAQPVAQIQSRIWAFFWPL